MSRRFNTSRIRKSCSYTIQEACSLLGIHKNTLRDWFRNGLPKTDNRRPHLIHGNDLKVFLDTRQRSLRKKCGLGELYCFRCRAPRRPLGNMVDLAPHNSKTVMLTGLCEVCEAMLHQLQSVQALPQILQSFEIPKQQVAHISEPSLSSPNCNLTKKGQKR